MGFLSNAVGQMIATMDPSERREAILEVTGQALALMSSAERVDLTRQLFLALIGDLDAAQRQALVVALVSDIRLEMEPRDAETDGA